LQTVSGRIQGRQKRYGEKDAPDGYKLSDNGIQGRMAFFKVEYKKIGAKNYTLVPIVFAVRRAADQDNFIAFDFKASSTSKHEFRLLPIGDIGAEIRDNGQKQFAFIENNGRRSRYDMDNGDQFKWTGRLVDAGPSLKEALEETWPPSTQTNGTCSPIEATLTRNLALKVGLSSGLRQSLSSS
jgi:hypothetical protein